MEKPFLDFSFSLGKLDVMSIGPGDASIGAAVSNVIKNVLDGMMVFPKKMVVPVLMDQDLLVSPSRRFAPVLVGVRSCLSLARRTQEGVMRDACDAMGLDRNAVVGHDGEDTGGRARTASRDLMYPRFSTFFVLGWELCLVDFARKEGAGERSGQFVRSGQARPQCVRSGAMGCNRWPRPLLQY